MNTPEDSWDRDRVAFEDAAIEAVSALLNHTGSAGLRLSLDVSLPDFYIIAGHINAVKSLAADLS
jgi:hypothetical protein